MVSVGIAGGDRAAGDVVAVCRRFAQFESERPARGRQFQVGAGVGVGDARGARGRLCVPFSLAVGWCAHMGAGLQGVHDVRVCLGSDSEFGGRQQSLNVFYATLRCVAWARHHADAHHGDARWRVLCDKLPVGAAYGAVGRDNSAVAHSSRHRHRCAGVGALWRYGIVDGGALYGHSDVAGVDKKGARQVVRLARAAALAIVGRRACREYGAGIGRLAWAQARVVAQEPRRHHSLVAEPLWHDECAGDRHVARSGPSAGVCASGGGVAGARVLSHARRQWRERVALQ